LLIIAGMHRRFADRTAAGKALAYAVAEAVGDERVVVLGVPNGGVAIAAPVAQALGAPLGVAWIGKLALPREPDVRVGAVDIDGDVTLNTEAVAAEGLDGETITELAFHAHQYLREKAGALPVIARRTVVIVDDGMTTGLTLIAALRWARRRGAARVLVAVPVVDARIWPQVVQNADEGVTLEVRPDGPIARSEIYDAYELVDRATVDALVATRTSRKQARSASPSQSARLR
jgi:putative phosphoribosyl transferase